jgi:predicted outer membrane lipoprotein
MPGSVMDDNRARNGTLGAILGVLVAIAFGIFLLAGGEHVGKKTVKSDADLPPIAGGKGK